MNRLSFHLVSSSSLMTGQLGALFGSLLKKKDTVLFSAPLGGGKTTFIQGVARGVGVKDGALSPTFLLAETLKGKKILHHLDFYRFSRTELVARGVTDYLSGQGEIPAGIVLIEWADRAPSLWPSRYFLIKIHHRKKETERRITFQAQGEFEARRLARYKNVLSKKKLLP